MKCDEGETNALHTIDCDIISNDGCYLATRHSDYVKWIRTEKKERN